MNKQIFVDDGQVIKIKNYEFLQEEYHIRIFDEEPIDIIYNSTMVLIDVCIVKIIEGNGIKTAKMTFPLCDYDTWDDAMEAIIKEALRL